jgi:hypothetical protein
MDAEITKLIAELANDLRPAIAALEAAPAVTNNHHGAHKLRIMRDEIIEKCAQTAEDWWEPGYGDLSPDELLAKVVAAIRALKTQGD